MAQDTLSPQIVYISRVVNWRNLAVRTTYCCAIDVSDWIRDGLYYVHIFHARCCTTNNEIGYREPWICDRHGMAYTRQEKQRQHYIQAQRVSTNVSCGEWTFSLSTPIASLSPHNLCRGVFFHLVSRYLMFSISPVCHCELRVPCAMAKTHLSFFAWDFCCDQDVCVCVCVW